MSRQFVRTFPGGKPEQAVTSVVLVNNTSKNVDSLVPAGKIWILLHIKALNPDDVDRGVLFYLYKEAAATNLISVLTSTTLTAGSAERLEWPNTTAGETASSPPDHLVIMVAGNILRVTWAAGGASAGGTDADGLVVEYLEIDA